MTKVAILWHMHQPYYEDLLTGEHILPWVRLHALKDYYGMVALLREFPDVRLTFNLVPSLLMQVEAFAAGRAHDRYLETSLKPAEELTNEDVGFMLRNFFHAQPERMIAPYPRYAELLTRRDAAGPDPARLFGVEDLRDLQIWHKLAWIDPLYLERDVRTRNLVSKGRQFTEDDKAVLRAIELEVLQAVIPAYREAGSRGQIELSTSPFYHPILPLLCDTDVNRRTNPLSEVQRPRFAYPQDAQAQLASAAAYHEQLFGHRPVGLWPSEGSVSEATVALAAGVGFEWMATDELILARTLGTGFTRDGGGLMQQPEHLYRPYAVTAEGGRIACAFRDHALSDLIGFVYARWPAAAAADDFVRRLVEAGRSFAARTGGEEAFIPVILDGENAWEHFEGGGRPFLRALYERLSSHPELRTVTMAEGCRGASATLRGIFPGSWIDASFDIWIGHRDDRRAWTQLVAAHQALDAVAHQAVSGAARAREELWIAEGSDWFWWYGEDHSSDHDAEFDDLFRRHLRNLYALIEKPVPDELFVSNITTGITFPPEIWPTAFVSPTLDGQETSYFEWLGAGRLEVREVFGTMHQVERGPSLLRAILFGFDQDRLYVRLDGHRPLFDLLASGCRFSVKFLSPPAVQFSVAHDPAAGVAGLFWRRIGDDGHWIARGTRGSRVAAGEVLEISLPLIELGDPGAEVAFFVAVQGDGGVEIERHPGVGPVRLEVPDAAFEARQWSA
jgi:alpha-amylase/alpha-mannosidase (GH57 family)